MIKNVTQIDNLTEEEFKDVILQVVKTQIDLLKREFRPKEPIEYMTRTDVSEMLKCDISTVHNYTVKGKLKAYGIGNRVYYKRTEVEAAIIPLGKGGSAI